MLTESIVEKYHRKPSEILSVFVNCLEELDRLDGVILTSEHYYIKRELMLNTPPEGTVCGVCYATLTLCRITQTTPAPASKRKGKYNITYDELCRLEYSLDMLRHGNPKHLLLLLGLSEKEISKLEPEVELPTLTDDNTDMSSHIAYQKQLEKAGF